MRGRPSSLFAAGWDAVREAPGVVAGREIARGREREREPASRRWVHHGDVPQGSRRTMWSRTGLVPAGGQAARPRRATGSRQRAGAASRPGNLAKTPAASLATAAAAPVGASARLQVMTESLAVPPPARQEAEDRAGRAGRRRGGRVARPRAGLQTAPRAGRAGSRGGRVARPRAGQQTAPGAERAVAPGSGPEAKSVTGAEAIPGAGKGAKPGAERAAKPGAGRAAGPGAKHRAVTEAISGAGRALAGTRVVRPRVAPVPAAVIPAALTRRSRGTVAAASGPGARGVNALSSGTPAAMVAGPAAAAGRRTSGLPMRMGGARARGTLVPGRQAG